MIFSGMVTTPKKRLKKTISPNSPPVISCVFCAWASPLFSSIAVTSSTKTRDWLVAYPNDRATPDIACARVITYYPVGRKGLLVKVPEMEENILYFLPRLLLAVSGDPNGRTAPSRAPLRSKKSATVKFRLAKTSRGTTLPQTWLRIR